MKGVSGTIHAWPGEKREGIPDPARGERADERNTRRRVRGWGMLFIGDDWRTYSLFGGDDWRTNSFAARGYFAV